MLNQYCDDGHDGARSTLEPSLFRFSVMVRQSKMSM